MRNMTPKDTQTDTHLDWRLKDVNETELNQEISASQFPVLVDFWAQSCLPCRAMEPLLKSMAETYKEKILFRKINVDMNPSLSSRLAVSGIPTFILFVDGKEANRQTGAMPKKALGRMLDQVLQVQ